MINTIKIKLRSAVACCWEAACLGCMALLMPFFGGSEVFSRNQVMSKDSEKRMRMTSKSSHSLVQRIHHALKRKDPVPASREAHGNGAIPQFWNVETEIEKKSLAVFGGVTETMFPAFFWCNDRNFLRVSTSFCWNSAHFLSESRKVEKNEALQRALQTIETESIRYRHLQHKPWLDDDGNTIWPWQRFLTEGAHPRYVCWDVSRCAIWIAQGRFKDEI